jgi:6-phosphogluconolactonase
LAAVGASSGAASYQLGGDGAVATITMPLETGELAACWLVASRDGRFAFVANTGSSSVSTSAVPPAGELTFRGSVPIDGTTAIDLALSRNGKYLYVLASDSDNITAFEVSSDGTLAHVETEDAVPLADVGTAAR